ncbi:MAG: sigma-70 family RNA polymerase sigma factor [Candidatus Zixiibacteriota bacterium]|nr:MAG: sigma-70 family RNA polymerase sigma factor [candidate division Zixibacteria bacterium]
MKKGGRTVTGKKVVCLDWVVEMGRGPRTDRNGSRKYLDETAKSPEEIQGEARRQEFIQAEVREALASLVEDEREFVELFHFSGLSYAEISEKSGRPVYRLEALHKRALKKLRRELAPLVEKLYDFEPDGSSTRECIICNSPFRPEIDLLIKYKEDSETWRGIIRELRKKYGIRIRTPQTLIGHQKYH